MNQLLRRQRGRHVARTTFHVDVEGGVTSAVCLMLQEHRCMCGISDESYHLPCRSDENGAGYEIKNVMRLSSMAVVPCGLSPLTKLACSLVQAPAEPA
jgi:hypothetical protein